MTQSSNLSILLNKFLDLYKRDVDALHRQLDDPTFVFSEDIPVPEQLETLRKSDSASQARIQRNTLINTVGHVPRHVHLQRELGDSREAVGKSISELLRESFLVQSKFEEIYGERNYATEAKDWQGREDTAVELLRFFAARIDSVAAAFDRLPDSDFEKVLPHPIRNLFRECHIAVALNSAATCCILCGAILEGALKQLVPGAETRFSSAEKANSSGLLAEGDYKTVLKIYNARDSAVHLDPKFDLVKITDAYKFLLQTRRIIERLYSARGAHQDEG